MSNSRRRHPFNFFFFFFCSFFFCFSSCRRHSLILSLFILFLLNSNCSFSTGVRVCRRLPLARLGSIWSAYSLPSSFSSPHRRAEHNRTWWPLINHIFYNNCIVFCVMGNANTVSNLSSKTKKESLLETLSPTSRRHWDGREKRPANWAHPKTILSSFLAHSI